MKTSSAKAKGRRLQQWVMYKIGNLLGLPCGPDTLIASREMGQSGVDIRLIGEALDRFPFSVECKNCERWNIPQWIEQAKRNEKFGTSWLLVVSRNRTEPVVVLDAEAFFDIMEYVDQKNYHKELPESQAH